jgi:hypothetical protein
LIAIIAIAHPKQEKFSCPTAILGLEIRLAQTEMIESREMVESREDDK